MLNFSKKLFNLVNQYIQLRREYLKTRSSDELNNELVIFNSVKSDELVFGVELLILLMLSRKGAKCRAIIDNKEFCHHDFIQKNNKFNYINPQSKLVYVLRRKLLTFLFRLVSTKVQIVLTSEIKNIKWPSIDEKIINNLCEKHASSSTKRYFQSATYDKSDSNHRDYYNLSYVNSELSIKIACYAIREKATKFITSHGIYSCWGPAYDYLIYKNFQNVYIYGTNTYKSGEIFISKEKLQLQSRCEFLLSNLNIRLQPNEILDAESYLESRVNKKTKDTKVYYDFDLQKLELDKSKKNIFLFPNVIWDGDIPEKDTLFNGLVDWILETIQFASNHKDLNFYIRFHPAETSWYHDSVKLEDIIIPLLSKNMPSNVNLILSGENIDLYKVLPDIDLVILYDGMLAIESSYLKIPFLLAGTGRFSVEGFGVIPNNKDEYFDALLNYQPDDNELTKIYDLGIKLLYIYNFLISVPLCSISNELSDFGVDLMNCNSTNIDLDNNKKLKSMIGIQ